MINLLAIILIYGIVFEEMRILTYKDKLRIEKQNRKRENEWFEYERKFIKESAILGERLRVSHEENLKQREEFIKKCEQFEQQCEEYQKQCEEINKKYEVIDNEQSNNITR